MPLLAFESNKELDRYVEYVNHNLENRVMAVFYDSWSAKKEGVNIIYIEPRIPKIYYAGYVLIAIALMIQWYNNGFLSVITSISIGLPAALLLSTYVFWSKWFYKLIMIRGVEKHTSVANELVFLNELEVIKRLSGWDKKKSIKS